jgi:putative beta-lysine N-acetyltransferase
MTKLYHDDIKPTPVKERSSIGVVELILGEGQMVKAIGAVYGMEHSIIGDGYEARLFLDQYNQRIKVQSYAAPNFSGFISNLRWLAEANGFDKIICMANRSDWQEFLKHGYVLEAVLKHYHRGEDAFAMSEFRSQERLVSHSLMEEALLIEKIIEDVGKRDENTQDEPLPEGWKVRAAKRSDIPELLELYQSIFETYPSPLVHSSYLETVFIKETLFAVCENEAGRIVAAGSAELHPDKLTAELTDCATLKEARGKGCMSRILSLLETELKGRKFVSSYTMARARSYGMNNVFCRLNYEFMGRMTNNCDIYGDYEDMNIWVKRLDTDSNAKAPVNTSSPGEAS